MQGHTVTIAEQHSHLVSLQDFCLETVNGSGPLQKSEAEELGSRWVLLMCRKFSASIDKAESLIWNQGSFILDKIQALSAAEMDDLSKDIALLFVNAVAGISAIVAQRDSTNKSGKPLPPVLLHQLAVLEHVKFCAIISKHQEHLKTT